MAGSGLWLICQQVRAHPGAEKRSMMYDVSLFSTEYNKIHRSRKPFCPHRCDNSYRMKTDACPAETLIQIHLIYPQP